MAVATPIPSCLGLGSYTSGSPAIVEAWFHGLQRGWRPHYTPTLGFHLIYRGKGPLKENAKASYEGSLPGVALDGGLVPALPRTRLEVSLPKGPIQTQEGRTLSRLSTLDVDHAHHGKLPSATPYSMGMLMTR